ncbi:MAG: hypothetical protein GAK35_00741 [Herbaspirillum frisingense]|uniref:Zinc finger/thioredoxin putative domain-containing protein n=1 Tax=Herbaspirillum frisingense TaxID=92645 RepID=A0A7V8FZE0_9BURK|nr:MAG: hypothetical protein GAK35_00741 [Herbaspirillum frisingense]
MALATQCPHCLTIFRVASDQLKLRGGLVRCGSCREVFNGQEFLVEASVSDGLYHPAPGSKAQPAAGAQPAPAVSPPPAVTPSEAIPEVNAPAMPASQTRPAAPAAAASNALNASNTAPPPAAPALAPAETSAPIPAVAEPKVFRSPASPGYIPDLGTPLKSPEPLGQAPGDTTPSFASQPAPAASAAEEIDTASLLRRSSADAQAGDDDPFTAYEDAAARQDDVDSTAEEEAEHAEASNEDEDAEEPAFVRNAERKERIGHVVKMAMMILAGVMVPLLLLQSIYYWRNPLAAAAPPLRPMLNGMCAAFHCTVGLPAEIERLSLESNELQVVPPNQNIYALTLVMRNRSASPQAWPHIELTLNNDDEKAVVRRVFRPREYLPNAQAVEAGIGGESEQQVKLTFELNDALVSGYRIYLFYP